MSELTLDKRIELIRAAIDRILSARQASWQWEQDPTSTAEARRAARERFEDCEREFGWQWENVKWMLDELDEMHKTAERFKLEREARELVPLKPEGGAYSWE